MFQTQEILHIILKNSMKFQCVYECAQCCIEREYFPSKEFGKIGVLILPEEKEKLEKSANEKKFK